MTGNLASVHCLKCEKRRLNEERRPMVWKQKENFLPGGGGLKYVQKQYDQKIGQCALSKMCLASKRSLLKEAKMGTPNSCNYDSTNRIVSGLSV